MKTTSNSFQGTICIYSILQLYQQSSSYRTPLWMNTHSLLSCFIQVRSCVFWLVLVENFPQCCERKWAEGRGDELKPANQVCTCFLKQPLTIPSITRMISTFTACFDFEYKPLKELRPRPHLYSGHHPPSKILCELAHLFVHQNQWKIRLHCQHLNSCCLLQEVQIILGTLRAVNENRQTIIFP